MNDGIKAALDERIEWIDAVADDYEQRGLPAVAEAVQQLDEEHQAGVLVMVLSTYAADRQTLRQRARDAGLN